MRATSFILAFVAIALGGCAHSPKPAPEPDPSMGSIYSGENDHLVAPGGLDKSVIDKVMRDHMSEILKCYSQQLPKKANLAGRIDTNFIINKHGEVSEAKITRSQLKSAPVENCVVTTLKSMRFPPPLGGGIVEVDYPFRFTPAPRRK